eukprot:1812123-Rhodomonas_salina.1
MLRILLESFHPDLQDGSSPLLPRTRGSKQCKAPPQTEPSLTADVHHSQPIQSSTSDAFLRN